MRSKARNTEVRIRTWLAKKRNRIAPATSSKRESWKTRWRANTVHIKNSSRALSRLPERTAQIESSLIAAYKKVIEVREVPFVRFGDLDAAELATAFVAYPMIIKPTLSCVNVAQRAISRDLGFDFDTYSTKVTPDQAKILAGYIKPFLPPAIAIPALVELDRYFWTDKELRAPKGN